MELSYVRKSFALALVAALAGCGGIGGGGSSPVLPGQTLRYAQQAILTNIVGVGDSLTAGYQADGIIGTPDFKNPIYHGQLVRPGQENGWWSLLYEQASGASLDAVIDRVYNPATSPLPLIAQPGLDNQIVPTDLGFAPFGQYKGTDSCTYDGGFDKAGFGLRASARVRMNPTATAIRDVGVPGITLHEANVLHQPQTDTCSPLPGIPGLLSDVVSEESGTFWPVLRSFTKLGGHLTEVNAAASVHPTLATVWLGANDVLKYMGSGGRFVGGDRTTAQVETDLQATIGTLQHAGARVIVADLPNILETGYFQRVTEPVDATRQCRIQSYAHCLLLLGGLQTYLQGIAKQYGLDTPGGCTPTSLSKPCGYLTLPAVVLILNYVQENSGQPPNLDCAQPAPHCKAVKGSGLGANYITPEFAAKVQALNNVVNQGIADAASASRVPLVPIDRIFDGLASGDAANPYFKLAASIASPLCCTLGYIYPIKVSGSTQLLPGGILSFDGIHPSNSGYGLIAYAFIDAINKAYGTHIAQVDLKAVYGGTRCSNARYCFKDPYAAH